MTKAQALAAGVLCLCAGATATAETTLLSCDLDGDGRTDSALFDEKKNELALLDVHGAVRSTTALRPHGAVDSVSCRQVVSDRAEEIVVEHHSSMSGDPVTVGVEILKEHDGGLVRIADLQDEERFESGLRWVRGEALPYSVEKDSLRIPGRGKLVARWLWDGTRFRFQLVEGRPLARCASDEDCLGEGRCDRSLTTKVATTGECVFGTLGLAQPSR